MRISTREPGVTGRREVAVAAATPPRPSCRTTPAQVFSRTTTDDRRCARLFDQEVKPAPRHSRPGKPSLQRQLQFFPFQTCLGDMLRCFSVLLFARALLINSTSNVLIFMTSCFLMVVQKGHFAAYPTPVERSTKRWRGLSSSHSGVSSNTRSRPPSASR